MKQKTRYLFFDLLRGWALILMMEAHVFNAFLQPGLRTTGWFNILNYMNGFVAPSFLFVSGAVFYLSTYHKSGELRTFGPSLRKKIYRILLIFLAGYSLHLPFLSLWKMTHFTNPDSLMQFYSVDILQCIAAGLLLIIILKIIFRKEEVFLGAVIFIFVITAGFSFLVWRIDLSQQMPLYLADYFIPTYGSLFPLLPWISFLMAGVIFSYFYLKSKEKGTEKKYIRIIFIIGCFLVAFGFLYLSELFVPPEYRKIKPNPVFNLQRTGYVMAFIAMCWYYFYKRGEKKSFITIVGMESLFVYWLHLQLIYRRLWNNESINSLINNSFDGWQCAAALMILTLLMILTAVIWNKFKTRMPVLAMYIVRGIVWVCVVIFLLT